MNQKEIEQDAQKIMDDFLTSMSDIEVEEDFILESSQCFREEGEGNYADEEFRNKFLNNAPQSKGDAIISKKGDWV